jgi:hypothetical protein
VGIGTSSPGVVLDVVGRIRTTDAAMILRSTGDVSTTGVGYLSFNGSDNVERGYVGFGAGNGSVTLANLTANPLTFVTNNAERMRIDSSGNVGIGGVPNAWHVNFDAIQLGSNYAAFVGDGSNAYAEVLNNAYASGATTYNYVASLAATRYSQQLGTHVWYAAGAGSSGNAISWLEHMRINASGNVGIGTSSPAYKLDVRGVLGAGNGTITTGCSWSTRGVVGTFSNHALGFVANGTEHMFLDTSGNLGLGVTPSAWNASFKAYQVGNQSLWSASGANGYLSTNGFFNTSGSYIYRSNGDRKSVV